MAGQARHDGLGLLAMTIASRHSTSWHDWVASAMPARERSVAALGPHVIPASEPESRHHSVEELLDGGSWPAMTI